MRISDWSSDVCSSDLNDPHSLLYATAGLTADEASGFPWTAGRGGFEVVRTLQMPDRLWTARFRSKPGFATFTERLMPWLVGFAGLMSSLFLYLIARGAARWHPQAVLLGRAQRECASAAPAKRNEQHPVGK